LGCYGDGGAILTNNDALAIRIKMIANHGQSKKYQHDVIGVNSRLDTLQAAILDIKLKNLDANNEKRRQNAQLYCKLLKNIGEIQLPVIEDGCVPVYHLFIVKVYKRNDLKKYLEEHGVSTGIHYPISISKLKCYENYFEEKYERAEKNSENIISLPMFPDLTEEEITRVCKLVIDFYIKDFPL
jgi:dTDP-4-amino-4,6-dideoxygalactose transaminase